VAGFDIILVLFYFCPAVVIISAGLTKKLLEHSRVFGALFILSGLLNFFILTSIFYLRWWFTGLALWAYLLGYTPSTIAVLVGISLIKPLRMLVARKVTG